MIQKWSRANGDIRASFLKLSGLLIKCICKIDYFGTHSDVRRDCNMTGHILSKLAKDLNPDNVGLMH